MKLTSVLFAGAVSVLAVGATGQALAKAHHHSWKSEVKEIQTDLNKSGAKLAIDGKFGKKTKEALEDFQKSHKLKANGKIDKATLAALRKA